MFVSLESDPDLVIVNTKVAIAVTNYRLRHHLLHFLRDDTDIGAIAAVLAETIVAKSVREMAKQDDIVFDHDVGSTSAATPAAATTTTEATAATEAAGSHAASAKPSSATQTRATASRREVAYSSGPHVC